MPSEIRNIIFTQAEVIRAVTEFSKRKGKPLPPGSVFKYSLHTEPRIQINIAIAVNDEARLEHFELAAAELGVALVMFCLQSKIPMPAKGAIKRLRVIGDSLGLVIALNVSTEQLEDFLPLA